MCNPAAFQVAAAAMSAAQQQANFSAVSSANKKSFEANKALALDDATRTYAALQARQAQEHAKASQAIDEVARTTAQKRSTATVGALEGGVGGSSIGSMMDEFRQVELNYQTTISRNRAMLDAQFGSELEATRAQAHGRILSGLPGVSQRPDLLGTLLSGFGKALEIKANEPKPVDQWHAPLL